MSALKALFMGGAGNISSAVSRMAVESGIELYLLNRGNRAAEIKEARHLQADIANKQQVKKLLDGKMFDDVVHFNILTFYMPLFS